jgi:hypothetical protein
MRSQFDTADYVKGLTVAGMARAHAQSAVDQASAANRPEDAATVADLERLKERIDAAALSAASDLKRFQLLTLAGIWMLCATILLLHFARQ